MEKPKDFIKLEKLTDKNYEIILDLFVEYQRFYKQESNIEQNREFIKNLLKSDSQAAFYVAKIASKNLAFVTVYFSYSSVKASKIAIINDLYVTQEYRKQGIASNLLEFVILDLKNRGFQYIRWCTENGNKIAQKLYDKLEVKKSSWLHYDLS